MGEITLPRTHPLEAWQEALAEVHVTVEPDLAMAVLRGEASLEVNTWRDTGDGQIVWLGPDESLVTSAGRTGEQLEADLREQGTATDVSAQRISLRLKASHARELLSTGTSHDLHPSVFGAGRSVQTAIAMTGVVLISLGENDYRILVRSSFAGYLAEWLLDAAMEFRSET